MTNEQEALLQALHRARAHIVEALQGLDEPSLRRAVLPSGWTCLGLVNHLAVEVERFWFQGVIAGEERVISDALGPSSTAWQVADSERAERVLEYYQQNLKRSDAIFATCDLDAAPAWWPSFFGSWRLNSRRQVILHVLTETSTHAGQLDAVRELIDGKLHIVLTD